MATWRQELSDAIIQGWCAALAINADFYDYWNELTPIFREESPTISRQFYRANCDREPPPGVTLVPQQGQCPAVPYGVVVTATYAPKPGQTVPPVTQTDGDGCLGGTSLIYGPIRAIVQRLNSSGNWQVFVDASNGAGQLASFVQTAPVSGTQYDPTGVSPTVTRCDGLADNCGGSQPPAPTPGYNSRDIDITYENNEGIDITIPTNLVYLSPTINIDGTVSIPVRVTIQDPVLNIPIEVDLNFNLGDGTVTDYVGPSSGFDPRGGCDDRTVESDDPLPTPPPSAGVPEGGDPEQPETERIIRGVVATVTNPGANVSEIFSELPGPNIFVPCAGWIHFLVRVGTSGNAWLPDIPVKNSQCFIECPWEGGAIDAIFFPRYGSAATLSFVYASREVPITDPGQT